MKINPILPVLVLTAGALHPARAQAPPANNIRPAAPAWVEGEILVQFKADVTGTQVSDAFRRGGLALKKHIHTPAMKDALRPGLSRVSTNLPIQAAISAVSNLPGVEFAEPNWIVSSQAESSAPSYFSNDPLYLNGSLWGMTSNGYGSQAEKAWAAGFTGSKDMFVGIIDAGIQFDHPDLAANVWTNPGEVPGNGIDDDGNGYVDDIHGWNAIGDNGAIYSPGTDTSGVPYEHYHGTHVAGTVGAAGGNAEGVAGMNWNVSLISGKFLGQTGYGGTADAIEAIDYMTALKTRKGLNIVALNNSWGGGAFSQALLDAIKRAAQENIMFIASAGNNSADTDVIPYYPSGYSTSALLGFESVISVAGINSIGDRRATSNWGATTVDLGAPGADILSTMPVNSYDYKSGTSMAAPHVSGAVALYATTHPGAAAAQTRHDLLTTVTPTDSLNGITVTGGRLDAAALMSIAPTTLPAPAAPAGVQATVISGGQVNLSWSDQSGDEWGFAIERASAGQAFILADTVGWNITSYSDRTVRPGNSYYYRVKAYNPGGASPESIANAGIPVSTPAVALPAAPAGLKATALAKGGISLAWADKSSNENTFNLERQTATAAWQVLATLPANTTTFIDASTVKRTTYSYRLRASNAAGFSSYSSVVLAAAK